MKKKPIKFYRTMVEDRVPEAASIEAGEMALNLFAGKEQIFVKNSNGQIAPFYSGKRTEELETRAQNIENAVAGLNQLDGERSKEINSLKNNVKKNTTSINNLNKTVDGHTTTIQSNTQAIADEKTRAEAQEALKLDKDRYSGTNIVTTLVNIPINKRLVIANLSAGTQVSLVKAMGAGEEVHVIVNNSGSSQITIPIPNAGIYVSTGSDSMAIEPGKYGEINFVSNGTNVFVRGL